MRLCANTSVDCLLPLITRDLSGFDAYVMAARAKLHFRTVVLTWTRHPHVRTAACVSALTHRRGSCLWIWKLSAALSRSIEVLWGGAGFLQAGPMLELRVSVTSPLFDARIEPQSFQCWERPANTALQHLSQVFLIFFFFGGGKNIQR